MATRGLIFALVKRLLVSSAPDDFIDLLSIFFKKGQESLVTCGFKTHGWQPQRNFTNERWHDYIKERPHPSILTSVAVPRHKHVMTLFV